MKQTYTLSKWKTKDGKNPIGKEYRNTLLYANIKGADLTDCDITQVTIHLPKMRCTFAPDGELRIKYGGATLTRKMGTSNGNQVERSLYMRGAKDTMFKDGNGEVTVYAYHPYDEGYLAIDDGNVTLEVEYTPKASQLEVPSTTVAAGSALAFKVASAGDEYSHKATLTMGDKTASVELAAGVTEGSIDVPLDWLEIIPDKIIYSEGVLLLETFKGETALGSTSMSNITMILPENRLLYAPVCGKLTTEPMYTVDGVTYPNLGFLVQGKSGLRVTMGAPQGKYGATVKTTKLWVNGVLSEGEGEVVVETGLLTSERLSFHASVIDSRGIETMSYPRMMVFVRPYSPPTAELDAYRVDENGERDDFGINGVYDCSYSYTDLGEAHPATVTLSVAGVSESNPPSHGDLLPSEFVRLDTERAYDVTLTVQDAYETVTRTVRIPSAAFIFHANAQGNGVGIGHAATKENALEINPSWGLWAGNKEIVSVLNQALRDIETLKLNGGGSSGGDGGTTTPVVPESLLQQVAALQTELDSRKPTTLWEGTWSKNAATITGIGDWNVVQVDMGVGSVLAFVSDETVQGGGFNVTGDLHRTLAFRATRSGDACTLVTAHYINHEAGSAHGDRQSQTVQRIVGLVHK